MTIKRIIRQIRFWMFLGNGYKRADYARKKGIFAEVGQHCKLPMAVPLYPELVRIHNNVVMHRSVKLVTHDGTNAFLDHIPDSHQFKHNELLCPIEIMDNVSIGMDTVILGNVCIGPNAIINAGSVVTRDVPPNSVVGGVPAEVVGAFDKYVKLRAMMDESIPYEFKRSGKESIDQKAVDMAWQRFDSKKNRVKTR